MSNNYLSNRIVVGLNDNYSSNKMVVGSNDVPAHTRVLRSNMKKSGADEENRAIQEQDGDMKILVEDVEPNTRGRQRVADEKKINVPDSDNEEGSEPEAERSKLRRTKSPTERHGKSNKRKGRSNSQDELKSGKRVRFLTEAEETGRVDTDEARPEDFHYLIGKIRRDDEDWLMYKTMKIYVHKYTNDIVGERAHVFKDGTISKTNEKDPIHIRDLAKLTEQ
jgi:hypothetical protein